jgi:putative iron-only hydrogenase system regulator
MDKEIKIASALITVEKHNNTGINTLNRLLNQFSSFIIARQGLSLPGKNFNIITLVLEADINTINSFAGKTGKISGINIKILIQQKIINDEI